MKKSLVMALSIALCAVLAIGGTMAYLSDTDSDVNVMTMGKVTIEQHETDKEGAPFVDQPMYPAVYDDTMPEENGWFVNDGVIDKVVTVENTGRSEAYLRTIFAFEYDENNVIVKNLNDDDWTWTPLNKTVTIKDGTYEIVVAEYKGTLAAGVTTEPSLKQLYMKKEATNEDIENFGDSYKVLVLSQAVQIAGFDTAEAAFLAAFQNNEALTADMAAAWFGEIAPPFDGENADTNWYADPTASVFYIDTADELAGLSKLVWNGNTFAGKTIKLTANINLQGENWQPIGRMTNTGGVGENSTFKGNFDGQGHTVSNFVVDTVDGVNDNNKGAGLFGAVMGNISNLTVENATIRTNHWGAALVGQICGNVTNCHVKNSTIECLPEQINGAWDNGDKAGAIAGYTEQTNHSVTNCTVTNVNIVAYRDMGAIVGYSHAAVKNNVVKNVTLTKDSTHDYKGVADDTTVNAYVGSGDGVFENNTGDVTIAKTITASNKDELQAALNAATEGTVVRMTTDITGDLVMPNNVKNITIDGNNHKLNGVINLNASEGTTIKNITFDAAYAEMAYDGKGNERFNALIMSGDATKPAKGARGLTIDNCTFEGKYANGGTTIAFNDQGRGSGQSGNITIKNCTFATEGGYVDIYTYYAGYGKFVIENNTFAGTTLDTPIYLGRYQSGTPVVVKGNTFNYATTQKEAMLIQDHGSYGVSFDASGNIYAD